MSHRIPDWIENPGDPFHSITFRFAAVKQPFTCTYHPSTALWCCWWTLHLDLHPFYFFSQDPALAPCVRQQSDDLMHIPSYTYHRTLIFIVHVPIPPSLTFFFFCCAHYCAEIPSVGCVPKRGCMIHQLLLSCEWGIPGSVHPPPSITRVASMVLHIQNSLDQVSALCWNNYNIFSSAKLQLSEATPTR